MIEYRTYTTLDGDTWDHIAWRFYNDPTAMEDIIRANAHVAITPVLPSGIELVIPARKESAAVIPNAQRPPWRAK
jgi:phage tail protein X